MKYFQKIFFTSLFLLLSLIEINGQDDKLETDTIIKPVKRIELIIKGMVLKEWNTLEVSEEDVRRELDNTHSFGILEDNYIVTGTNLNKPINSTNTDAKYQISFRQRVTNSYLPFNTFIFISYTQKAFWNIYKSSSPFRDTNYNPGIGFGKYLISKDNNYMGSLFLQFEHESNGKDSIDSRSWDFVTLSGKYYLNDRVLVRAKICVPFVFTMGEENDDLLTYKGYSHFSVDYITPNNKWWFTTKLTPRHNLSSMNTSFSVAFKSSKKLNQYLFVELYNGRGDSLLDYKEYDLKLRIGVCIKPDFFSVF